MSVRLILTFYIPTTPISLIDIQYAGLFIIMLSNEIGWQYRAQIKSWLKKRAIKWEPSIFEGWVTTVTDRGADWDLNIQGNRSEAVSNSNSQDNRSGAV